MKKNNLSSYKNFINAFKLVRKDPRKFHYRLQNYQFSRNEFLLLQAYKAYTLNDRDKVFELVRNKKFNEVFLEATRLYLLGLTLNHYSSFHFAIEKLEESVSLYKKCGAKDFLFYPYVALTLCYANQKKMQDVENCMKLLTPFLLDCPYQKMAKMHALCVGHMVLNQLDEALEIIQELYRENSSFLELYLSGLLVIEFSIKLKKDKPDDCHEILCRYKKSNGFAVRANYVYMKSLLNHIYNNAPLYVYKKDFEHFPELYDQLEFIKAIARGDKKKASSYWKILQKHNGDLYRDDYFFAGDLCLFSMALQKHEKNLKKELPLKKIEKKLSPIEKLEILFAEKNMTILKEELISYLWQEEVSEVTMARLRKLISRYNKLANKKIVSYQESYKKIS